MMKNLTKAALLAMATAFLLAACSHSSGGGDKFSSHIKVVSAEELGASAESAESSDASVVTAAIEDGGVKLTSKKEGSATVTAKANGYNDATISVTVSANGEIKAEVTQGFEPAGNPNFPSKTDESTANDEATLGLVGTSTDSSNPSVATAKIEGDKIVITSHGAGTAVITVKDAEEHTAGIEVSVADNGTITIEKITKYDPDFPSRTNRDTANDEATLGLVGTSTDSSNPSIATAKIEGDKIVITSHGAGSATITVKDGDKKATIEVSVAADGTITIGEITKYEDEGVTGTTYAWNFQADGLTSILTYTNNDEGKPTLDAAGTYESTPAGLTLNLPEGGVFNKVEPNTNVSSSVKLDGATKGLIEPDGKTLLTVDVKGPFTAVMLCAANASSDKTDRYAYITVDGEEVCAPNRTANKLLAVGEKLSYTYEGTDTVTVGFGGTNYVRIHDIKIITANGDDAGKTAGEVKSKATFVSQTDDTTANDEATLGLVGTSADSSNPSVATAKVDSGKIVITSVGAGTATITVKDSNDNKATIEVTVGGTGKITIGEITKYRAPIDMSKATVLIDYPTGKDGITLATPTDGAPSYNTVKIHTNTDSVDCISLSKSGADYGVTLSVSGGFKAGDVIEIAGAYNNAATKQGAVTILNGSDTLFTTKDFINGRTVADDPESETYVLEADAESLVLSRAGSTTTCITLLKVIRPSAE